METIRTTIILLLLCLLYLPAGEARVNINQGVSELLKIPRISSYLARKIIQYRRINGPFKNLKDLENVEGFDGALIERISPYIELGRPSTWQGITGSRKVQKAPLPIRVNRIYQGLKPQYGRNGLKKKIVARKSKTKKTPEKKVTISTEVKKKVVKKRNLKDILSHFDWEPGIGEIQDVAQKYADVNPELIRDWRHNAARKEFLPDVTISYKADQTDDAALSSSGVPTESRGIGQGLTVNMSWDLAELMFNKEQITINNESSDLVKLRDDVLDEVTKLYFDRRKLQIEIYLNPETEIQEALKKELRLRELTANIDALTGGYLSREIKKRKKSEAEDENI
ncbi:ComEA family DNA-binding protein [Candidatus Riflebacteria bacterium]